MPALLERPANAHHRCGTEQYAVRCMGLTKEYGTGDNKG